MSALLVTKEIVWTVKDALTLSTIAADVILQSLIQKSMQISDSRKKTSGFGVLTVPFVMATTSQAVDRNVFSTPQVLLLRCCLDNLCVQAVQVVEVAHTVHYELTFTFLISTRRGEYEKKQCTHSCS